MSKQARISKALHRRVHQVPTVTRVVVYVCGSTDKQADEGVSLAGIGQGEAVNAASRCALLVLVCACHATSPTLQAEPRRTAPAESVDPVNRLFPNLDAAAGPDVGQPPKQRNIVIGSRSLVDASQYFTSSKQTMGIDFEQLRGCYKQALALQPMLTGRVVYGLIFSLGAVSGLKMLWRDGLPDRMTSCVEDVIRRTVSYGSRSTPAVWPGVWFPLLFVYEEPSAALDGGADQ